MRRFDQMKDAHKQIYNVIDETEKMLKDVREHAPEIAKGISRLAGTLKMHLGSEDKFLYPAMMASDDENLQNKATEFQTEMGGLSKEFAEFKEEYNTPGKVTKNKDIIEKDATAIFEKIRERMIREDNELYPLAEKVM